MEKMLLAITVILLGLSVLVSGDAAAELPQKTIMGVGKSSEISITIGQDGHVSGYLTVQGEGKDDLRLLIDTTRSKALKDDRFIILDKQNEILILGKIVGDDKYLLKTRIKLDSDSKINLRHLADVEPSLTGNKDGSQRDLTSEMEKLQNKQEEVDLEKLSFQERQALELKSKVEEEARLFQERIEKLNQKSKQDKLTHKEQLMQEALKAIQEKQRQNSENANAEEPEEPASGAELSGGKEVLIVLRSPHSGYWNEDYEFSLKVYDPKINRYSDFEFRSGKIADVAIVGKIVNPRGTTIDTIRGTTTSEGYFEYAFNIPYLSLTHGAYSLELTATKTYSDGTYSEDTIKEPFYVRDGADFDTDHKPIAEIRFVDDTRTVPRSELPSRYECMTNNETPEGECIVIERSRDKCVMADGTPTDDCIMIERTTENQMQIILDTLKMEYARESNITFDLDTITLDANNMFESDPVRGLYDEVFQVGCVDRPPLPEMCPVPMGVDNDMMCMDDDDDIMECTNDEGIVCMYDNNVECTCEDAPRPLILEGNPDHCKLDNMKTQSMHTPAVRVYAEPHDYCGRSDEETSENRIPETTLGQVACLLEQAGSDIDREITKGDGQIYLGIAEIPQSPITLELDGSESRDPDHNNDVSHIWRRVSCENSNIEITDPMLRPFTGAGSSKSYVTAAFTHVIEAREDMNGNEIAERHVDEADVTHTEIVTMNGVEMEREIEVIHSADGRKVTHKTIAGTIDRSIMHVVDGTVEEDVVGHTTDLTGDKAEITHGPPADMDEFCVDLVVVNDRKVSSDPARVEVTTYNGTIHHGRE